MPDNRIFKKAGKIFFLLVCLLLWGCQKETMEFVSVKTEERAVLEEEKKTEIEKDPLDGLVDLNHATKEELMTLPWIGEVRAEAIIAYRTANGPYTSIEDVMNVRGIKEGIFRKISKLICVK